MNVFFDLLELGLDLFIAVVMLRFLLQWVKADFNNPFCQFLIKVTNPVLVPLRGFVPGKWGVDCAAIVLMVILKAVELIVLSLVSSRYPMIGFDYLWMVPVSLIQLCLNIFFFAIILRSISSWVNPRPDHPMTVLLYQLTEPLLAPIREKIPPIVGIDFSPMIVLLALPMVGNFIKMCLGI